VRAELREIVDLARAVGEAFETPIEWEARQLRRDLAEFQRAAGDAFRLATASKAVEHSGALELKFAPQSSSFEGWASKYHELDDVGDVVMPGAFTETLAEHGNTRPLLWAHRQDEVIGRVELTDQPKGLWARGYLAHEVKKAQEARALIQSGSVRGLSIGYLPIRAERQPNGVRHLLALHLAELSLVPVPALRSATLSPTKGIASELEHAIAEFQEAASAWTR
jgi:HK97 family phage prohead protease